MRAILAALVGGIVVFVWGAVSHMVLPLGDTGLAPMGNEGPIIAALRTAIPERGLYFFPSEGYDGDAAQREAWQRKVEEGPVGMIVYRPDGETMVSPKRLGIEFASNVAAALIAAVALSAMAGAYAKRVLVVALLGLFGWLSINVSYWNWYGFPDDFTLAQAVDQVVGWFLAGIPMAAIVKPRRALAS